MKNRTSPLLVSTLNFFILLGLFTSALALDTNQRIQDPYSASSAGKILSPSTARPEPPTKMPPTTDQKFITIFSKLAGLEQTGTTLQNQVNVQAQLITQLKQLISVNSSGTVTIQAPGTLKITVGGTLNMAGSTVDVNPAITAASMACSKPTP